VSALDGDHDQLVFAPEAGPLAVDAQAPHWTVLVVDDDEAVHQVTRLVLDGTRFEGRPIELIGARSGGEARAILDARRDVAVVLLDVVMEADDAGLALVRHIRAQRERAPLRIVLRTGQPAQAPPRRIIVEYDINDYRGKAELTADELFSSVISALRSFRDLQTIQAQAEAAGRFVPHDVLRLLGRPSLTDAALGDHTSGDISVLVSDMRGFTTLCERMTPVESFDFTNTYLSLATPIIHGNGGFVVKYMGDGLMAAFPRAPEDAVASALHQLAALEELNRKRGPDQPRIGVGIGVHAGRALLGIVGAQGRFQADLFSDAVNLAARVEGLTKTYGVPLLVTADVAAGLSARRRAALRPLGRSCVPGRVGLTDVYEVLDADAAERAAAKRAAQPAFDDGLQHFDAGRLAVPGDGPALHYLMRTDAALNDSAR
jgi:two-component system sensor histidine kinase ChiS